MISVGTSRGKHRASRLDLLDLLICSCTLLCTFSLKTVISGLIAVHESLQLDVLE